MPTPPTAGSRGQLVTNWNNQAIATEADLFVANTPELTQALTLRDARQTPDTHVLAKS
jgi:hypothetical protein